MQRLRLSINAKSGRLKEDKGRIVYLTTDQMNKLLDAAKKDQCPYIYPFIVVGLGTFMRRMKILSIQLKNIDLDKQENLLQITEYILLVCE